MSININSKMIYGMGYSDWQNFIDSNFNLLLEKEDLCFGDFIAGDYPNPEYEFVIEDVDIVDFLYERLGFCSISPYYDCRQEDRCFGVEMYNVDGTVGVSVEPLIEKISESIRKLYLMFGEELYNNLGPNLEVIFGADIT